MTLNKYIYLFNLVNNQEHALISVFGSLLVHFLSGFGVTFGLFLVFIIDVIRLFL